MIRDHGTAWHGAALVQALTDLTVLGEPTGWRHCHKGPKPELAWPKLRRPGRPWPGRRRPARPLTRAPPAWAPLGRAPRLAKCDVTGAPGTRSGYSSRGAGQTGTLAPVAAVASEFFRFKALSQ